MVYLGDNSTISVISAGTIRLILPSRIISIEALFIPRLKPSLLSVSQLSTKYPITFRNEECFLDTCIIGFLSAGVYRLISRDSDRTLTTNNADQPTFANSAVLPSIELWHQRLGHLSYQTLYMILPREAYSGNLVERSFVCEVCVKAKHQRKIERKPAPRTTRPSELIHSDLCGLITPESVSGLRYFILYIDDFPR